MARPRPSQSSPGTQQPQPAPFPDRAKEIADATIAFLDVIDRSGLIWPRRDGQVVPDDWPQKEVRNRFALLEFELNLNRASFDDPSRVGDLLKLASDRDAITPGWEVDPSRPLVAVLAVAVDTIIRWWGLEQITNLNEWSLGPIGSRPEKPVVHLEKNNGWPPSIPRLLVEQMRAAACALETAKPVEWPYPASNAETVATTTIRAARKHAENVLMAIHSILEDLNRQPEVDPVADRLLLWRFHEMQMAAAAIPSRGWQQCYGSTAFRDFNTSGPCAHLAARDLSHAITIEFGNAAGEAIRSRWGVNLLCGLIPLIWTPEARPLLHGRLLARGKLDLKYWIDQFSIETSKLSIDSVKRKNKTRRPRGRPDITQDERARRVKLYGDWQSSGQTQREFVRAHGFFGMKDEGEALAYLMRCQKTVAETNVSSP
jgi:hypothetical protein